MLKVGDVVKWEGNFFSHYKKGASKEFILENLGKKDFKPEDYIVRKYDSGINRIQRIYYEKLVKGNMIQLDNGKEFSESRGKLIKVTLVELINHIYQKFCDETKRNGGVLVHSSIGEWHDYLVHWLKVFEMAA